MAICCFKSSKLSSSETVFLTADAFNCLQLGHLKKAITTSDKILKDFPNNKVALEVKREAQRVFELYDQAQHAYERRNFQQAIHFASLVLQDYPFNENMRLIHDTSKLFLQLKGKNGN